MNNVFVIQDSKTLLYWRKSSECCRWRGEGAFKYNERHHAQAAIAFRPAIMKDAKIVEFYLTKVTSDDSEH